MRHWHIGIHHNHKHKHHGYDPKYPMLYNGKLIPPPSILFGNKRTSSGNNGRRSSDFDGISIGKLGYAFLLLVFIIIGIVIVASIQSINERDEAIDRLNKTNAQERVNETKTIESKPNGYGMKPKWRVFNPNQK